MTLYEISNTYQYFLEQVEAGNVPEEAVNDTLEAIEGEFVDKADNVACMIKNLNSEAQAIKNEVENLSERMVAKQHQADRLNKYLYEQLKLSGKTKIETARNLLQIKNNPPSIEILDAEKFVQWAQDNADNLLTFKLPVPNKTAIKQALQGGQAVPNVQIVKGDRLTIK